MLDQFLGESVEMGFGFREEYSPASSYALTGSIGGVFGAATPGRAAAMAATESKLTLRSELKFLRAEAGELAQQARGVASDFAAGYRAYKPSGTFLGSGGGGAQEFTERVGAGLRNVGSGAAGEGATISIKKPSVFSDPNLSPDELRLAEKAWNLKKSSLSRAAERGELKWSPGTEDVRIAELQAQYRTNVADRYRRRFGQEPDFSKLNADHPVDIIVGGSPEQPLKMIYDRVNKSVGASLRMAGKRAKLNTGDKIGRINFEE